MLIKGPDTFPYGVTSITQRNDKSQNTLMDFNIIRLAEGGVYKDNEALERALLLIEGKISLSWGDKEVVIDRKNCFDFSPWVLHLPSGVEFTAKAEKESELAYMATENSSTFDAKLYSPQDCASENRGAGTMREASTRIVRTVFDFSNAPYSKLVLGEVIGFPGKWSSYPPHHHPQPEIYFYKFLPENGYGFSQLNDSALMTKHNSTVLIVEDETHPQVTAPGYAMWYLWVIRHLDDRPYITPTFIDQHLWVTDQAADIWPKDTDIK
ncbi:MAG: 5-deoxy-glucuronate isomerase [Clostridiales bacterium]|nr:5-deoxy-glucuronate isomerase [Clostridiales bacterium]